jgi:hypothetical protein
MSVEEKHAVTQRVLNDIYFIEDRAFSPSYDLAPSPPPSPSTVSKLSLFLSLPVSCQSILLTGREGVEEEPNHTTTRKPGALLNHSLLSTVIRAKRRLGIDSKESIPPAHVLYLGGPVGKPNSDLVPSPHRLFKNSSTGSKEKRES